MAALISILALFEVVCTGIGVSAGYIAEGNPLVARLFDLSIVGTCAGVLLLVGMLLWLIAAHANKYAWITYALCFVLFFKVAVALRHVYWIFMVL